MKVNTGTSIHQSETHGILELKTNIRKGKRKSKETGNQNTEGKGND